MGDVNQPEAVELKAMMRAGLVWTAASLTIIPMLIAPVLTMPTAFAGSLVFSAILMLVLSIIISTRSVKFSAALGLTTATIALGALIIASGGLASPFLPLLVLLPLEAHAIFKTKQSGLHGISATMAIVASLLALDYLQIGQNTVANSALAMWATCAGLLSYALVRNIGTMKTQNSANIDPSIAYDLDQTRLSKGYSEILLSLPGLVTRHNPNGFIIKVGGQNVNSFNKSKTSLNGQGFLNQIHVSDRINFLQAIDKLRQGMPSADAQFRFEVAAISEDTHQIYTEHMTIHAHLIGIFNDNGDLIEFITQSQNVTELVNMENELSKYADAERDADIIKTRFLAGVSHELRTPLNSILGFADIILHEVVAPLQDERQREYMSLIKQSGEHLLNVVNTMLDMSKIQNGQYDIYTEHFEFEPLLSRTKAMLDIQASSKNITLNCRTPNQLGEMYADSNSIQQILINLVGNAIKFTEDGGVVTVDANTDDKHFILSVGDTGIGIPADQLNRLGQPFVQVCSSLARKFEGTGLGLALVKGLTELHHGQFHIESEEGIGTKVTIKIPHEQPIKAERKITELEHFQSNWTDEGKKGGQSHVA